MQQTLSIPTKTYGPLEGSHQAWLADAYSSARNHACRNYPKALR